MDPVSKAIWFVEGHLTQEFDLEDVASVAGLSRHHLVRAFGWTTGRSVMRYVRARRLTEAARRLAADRPEILPVALDAGYGSHEAFTRAFRDQFGLTPEQVRARARLEDLQLTEPLMLEDMPLPHLAAPRTEQRPGFRVAGLIQRHDHEASAAIPIQWSRFAPWLGHIPGQVGWTTYGVIFDADDEGADYMCAVEVDSSGAVPAELVVRTLAPQTYAIFAHGGHITEIRSVWIAIWREALPKLDRKPAAAPSFERYGENFDPRTGNGGFEIWIPVEA
jgi:AraC family transcriptional regulator